MIDKECCGLKGLGYWSPETDGQESHYLAGQVLMCLECGETLTIGSVYQKFLKSKQWEKLRKEVLERDGFGCVNCGRIGSEVHHENYGDIFDINSMISLCSECHSKIHGKKCKPKGWAISLNIKKIAEEKNMLNCPSCDSEFKFNEEFGKYNCSCDSGGIKKFMKMCILNKKVRERRLKNGK